ncbi:phage holin family protein [Mesohalobacter halotolerans]|jgi:putative membrane protein|uniref:Phage holin family protein n=1 Tax=Mesohalobacter halotolerans TaxID=1883405 RepID=A0A4U5TQ40_9FLAO|nr:phage holin family protein [Mesohalobacter halotolerans]MBS3737624.1 phage holin family protein [Psychroflexus sp.]NBC58372.1 phage holin family protein [Bacteroidota bacterium]TKS55454.1 phage holin family protein [Mesohalobacter halotolerans]
MQNSKSLNTLVEILLSAIAVVVLANILPGIKVSGFLTAIVVAAVLILLNLFVKPILIVFTLPVTIVTFGLFLLVINALIILLCDALVGGFDVSGFWSALFFSILLSIFQSFLFALSKKK